MRPFATDAEALFNYFGRGKFRNSRSSNWNLGPYWRSCAQKLSASWLIIILFWLFWSRRVFANTHFGVCIGFRGYFASWVGGVVWIASLNVIIVHTIDDDVSGTKIFGSLHTLSMWHGWLIGGPVVERWVLNWVGGLKIIEVHAINDNVSGTEVLSSLHTLTVWDSWLIGGPVVKLL